MANAEFNVVISLEMLHRVGYFLPSKKTDISGSGFNHRLTNCDLSHKIVTLVTIHFNEEMRHFYPTKWSFVKLTSHTGCMCVLYMFL